MNVFSGELGKLVGKLELRHRNLFMIFFCLKEKNFFLFPFSVIFRSLQNLIF